METRGRQQRQETSGRRSPSAPAALQGEEAIAQSPQLQAEIAETQGSNMAEELLANTLAGFRMELRDEATHTQQELQEQIQEQMLQMEQRLARLIAGTTAPQVATSPPVVPQPTTRLSEPLSTTHGPKLRASDFPKFKAEHKEDIDDWIEQVSAIYDYSGADEQQLLKILPLLLEGQALEWFTGLRNQRNLIRHWTEWQDALRTAFRAPNYEERLRIQLTRRRLKDEETFSTYLQDKIQLAYKCYGDNMPLKLIMEEVIMGFPGHMHSEIRNAMTMVRLENGSLEDFKREVLNHEYGLRQRSMPRPAKGSFNNNQDKRQGHNNQARNFNANSRFNRQTDQPRQQQYQQYQVNRTITTSNVPNTGAAATNVVTCYNCGKAGHYSRDCKSPKRIMPAPQNNWRDIRTSTNCVELPFNRYEESKGLPTANAVTTRSKETTSSPPPTTTVEPATKVLRITNKVHQPAPNIPLHVSKTPAYAALWINAEKTMHKACIDSGSSISLIDEGYLRQHIPNVKTTPCSNFILQSLGSGSQVWSYTDVEIAFQTDKMIIVPVRLYLSPYQHTKIILGNDILHTYGANINLDKGHLSFQEFPKELITLNLERNPADIKTAGRRILVRESCTIQPGTALPVPVFIDKDVKDGEELIISSEQLNKNKEEVSGIVNTVITKGQDNKALYANYDDHPITITAGTEIGLAEPLQEAIAITNYANATNQDVNMFLEALKAASISEELDTNQAAQLQQVLIDNRQAFAYGERVVGNTSIVQLTMDTGDAAPISQPPYHASPAGRKIIEDNVNEMLDQGIVEPSESPWGSPVVLVKQGEKTRFCVDYRQLNSVTKMDQYPLPRIDDILSAFQGKKYMSSFDANKGFNQIECASEEDMDKLAFRTHLGLFRYRRMPFGIHKGPGVFQRLMDIVLGASKWKHALVYIDDIIVYSDTFEEHMQHIGDILGRITKSGITLSLKKSFIAKNSIQALGHTISDLGIGTAPHNVKAVKEFPVPTNSKEVQRFIGMAVYYRRFIKDFAKIAKPLHHLCSDKVKFKWTDEEQESFDKLKDCLISEPILAHPRYDRPFLVYTDASTHGLGAILSQKNDDGTEVVVCYLSRTLSPAEANYTATELECLGAIWAIKKLHAYLDGSKFELITDHSALQWLFTFKGNNRRLSRWVMELQHHRENMTITYRQGRKHSNVDSLSRAPLPHEPGDIIESYNIETLETPTNLDKFHQQIKDAYKEDEYATILMDKINTGTLLPHQQHFQINNELLWRHHPHTNVPVLYVPTGLDLRLTLLHDYHDAKLSGHLGRNKTYERMASYYWWPTMSKDIKEYVRSCASCQRNKGSTQLPSGQLHPIKQPSERWHTVTMDFTGPFPPDAAKNDMITVVVDKFTKRTHFYPSRSTDKAPQTAKLFFHNIIRLHGQPKVIISDRDAKFTSKFWIAIFTIMGTRLAKTTSFHPQADGQTERLNRTLKEMIRHYINYHQNNWSEHLDVLEFAYNDTIQQSTKMTPFELDLGYHPLSPLRPTQASDHLMTPEAAESFLDTLKANAQQAEEAINHAQEAQAEYYNESHKASAINIGDSVLLNARYVHPDFDSRRTSRKLLPKYYGPYKVLHDYENGAYKIELPETLQIHPNVNIQHLKLFHHTPPRLEGRNEPPPPPVIVDGEEEYEVEAIVDERQRRNRTQYLVKWKGYADHDNTWLPRSELEDTQALRDYEEHVQNILL